MSLSGGSLRADFGVIADARARQRRRRWLVVLLVALAAGSAGALLSRGTDAPRVGAASVQRLAKGGAVQASCVLTRPSPDRPDQAWLQTLAVLRHPPTPTDQLPGPISAHLFAHAIRLAQSVDGVRYYVMPHYWPRCAPRQPIEVVTLVARARLTGHRTTAVGFNAFTVTELRKDGLFGARFSRLQPQTSALFGIVPDGVASVTLRYGTARTSVTARVINNVVVFPQPPRTGPIGAFGWKTMTWRARDGRVIKTLHRP
jgi:hypothetical protein